MARQQRPSPRRARLHQHTLKQRSHHAEAKLSLELVDVGTPLFELGGLLANHRLCERQVALALALPAALAEQVRQWRRPVDVASASPYRLCFRLEEPSEIQRSPAFFVPPVR